MKNCILKRSIVNLLPVFGIMIVAGLSITTEYDSMSVLHWGWFLVFISSIIYIFIRLLYPEMILKDGKLCFFEHKRKLWRWVCLPVYNIKEVRESERKAAGIGQSLLVPTFIFIMNDGTRYEYFPGEKPGKRLSEIEAFLNNVEELPQIFPRHEGI